MKILFIIGNGFDLNLGLKTSYKHFYNYYESIETKNPEILKLKKSISSNYNNWSDLELAIGNYTKELKTIEAFDVVFEDIGEKLADYLKIQESQFDSKRINQNSFFEYLSKPENVLPLTDKETLSTYKSKFANQRLNIDIFTFNYTTTIEKIIGGNKNIKINPINLSNVYIRTVEHIHGYTDNRMVLGVNDLSQLKNKDFHNNEDVLEAIIKEKCNKSLRHNIDSQFKSYIHQADLICIFGSSIGDTDNIWWEIIGKKLVNKIPLIIFTKGEEAINPRLGYKNNRTERKLRKYFLNKTNLSTDKQEEISENIYISIDSQMFKDIIIKK